MANKHSAASHIPLLVKMVHKSEGDILEIGTGYFSTTVLHWLAELYKRHLYSYENNPRWVKWSKRLESEYHHIISCESWEKADFDKRHWGLVFIDHAPGEQRAIELERLKDCADYLVIHDTEPGKESFYPGMQKTLELFKYRHDDKKVLPYTTVVSNIKSNL